MALIRKPACAGNLDEGCRPDQHSLGMSDTTFCEPLIRRDASRLFECMRKMTCSKAAKFGELRKAYPTDEADLDNILGEPFLPGGQSAHSRPPCSKVAVVSGSMDAYCPHQMIGVQGI